MTYIRDNWEAEPGQVVCRHNIQVAMDTEGVVRHKGGGSLCTRVPAPSPIRGRNTSLPQYCQDADGKECLPEDCQIDGPHYIRHPQVPR